MGSDPLGDDRGAELLGPSPDGKLGCLDPGCAADLVAVAGDPLVDVKALQDIKAVVAAGRVAKGRQRRRFS